MNMYKQDSALNNRYVEECGDTDSYGQTWISSQQTQLLKSIVLLGSRD